MALAEVIAGVVTVYVIHAWTNNWAIALLVAVVLGTFALWSEVGRARAKRQKGSKAGPEREP